jgi:hypothetical protein
MVRRPLSATSKENLTRAVAELAIAIDRGEVEPQALELAALAVVCDRHGLPAEAARIRAWLQGAYA